MGVRGRFGWRTALACFLGTLALAAPATAQSQSAWPTVAVLSVEVRGGDLAVAESMGERLLEAVGMQPMVEPESFLDLRLSEALPMAGCTEASSACLLALTESLGVSGLVLAQATPSARSYDGWLVQVRYFDATSRRDVFDVAVEVPAQEPALWLGRVADSLMQGRGVLDVRASSSVSLRLEGESMGQAPALLTALVPGRTQLELCPADGRCRRVQVEVRAGALHVVDRDGAGGFRVDADERGEAQRQRTQRAQRERVERNPLPVSVWVLGGMTAAAGTTALVYGVRAREDRRAFEEATLRADAQAIADRGERHTRFSQVSTGIAIAGALGTTALVWRHHRRTVADTALGVVVLPEGASVRFHHRW